MAEALKNYADYRSYANMRELPQAIGPHSKTADGKLVVRFGEIRCRVGSGNALCGQKFKSRGALVTHIKKQHGEEVAEADNENRPSTNYINQQKAWYTQVMERHKRREDALAAAQSKRVEIAKTATSILSQSTRIPPVYNTEGNWDAREFDYKAMTEIVRMLGHSAPCDTCIAKHNGEHTETCAFDFELDDNGEQVLGGWICESRKFFKI